MAVGKLYAANVPDPLTEFESLVEGLEVTSVVDPTPDTHVTILRDGIFQYTHHSLVIVLTSEGGQTTEVTMTGNSSNVVDGVGNAFILEGCIASEIVKCKSSGQDYVSEV